MRRANYSFLVFIQKIMTDSTLLVFNDRVKIDIFHASENIGFYIRICLFQLSSFALLYK